MVILLNFISFNPKHICAGKIRCPCVKCKNKKFHNKNIVMIHLLKNDSSRNTYVGLHVENSMFLIKTTVNTNNHYNNSQYKYLATTTL